MVSPPSALSPILGVVRNLVPTQGIIHVGAGNGAAASELWRMLEAERVLLLDGDPGQATALASAASRITGGEAGCALLGAAEEDVAVFSLTSHSAANGRLDVDTARALWPNLRLVDTLQLRVHRLDAWLDERFGENGFPADWLVVDCLPALPVLAGGGDVIDRVEFIWATVLLDPDAPIGGGASLHEVADFLRDRGFRQLATIERLHPALGDALFIRDWRLACASREEALAKECAGLRLNLAQAGVHLREAAARQQTEIERLVSERDAALAMLASNDMQIAELRQSCAAQAVLASDRVRQLEDQAKKLAAATQTRDALSKSAADLKHRLDEQAQALAAMTEEHDTKVAAAADLCRRLDEQANALAAVTEERDILAKDTAECWRECEAQAEALAAVTAERDVQAKAATDRQRKLGEQALSFAAATERRDALAVQIEALTRTIGELTRRGMEQDDLIKSLNAELKQAGEFRERLEARLLECDSRQQRVDEEMLRAEAQLDLIKDLLLRS